MSVSGLLRVLSPGLHTTVQDLGRFGYQDQGVPVAGMLDPVALALANALVGNLPDEAGLELHTLGPTLLVEADSIGVAISGPARPSLTRDGDTRILECERGHTLRRGDRLATGAVGGAAVAVLAVAGGFDLAPVMGSLSTYVRAGIGPLNGRALEDGDLLPLRGGGGGEGDLALPHPFEYGSGPLRVVLGPQAGAFTDRALETFLSAEFTVGRDADRMGLRLEGPELAHRSGAGIASEGIVTGAVQVPGNGRPILLLADHQTVGGYAKIATVISADLPRAGRMAPGTRLSFRAVTVAEAAAARRDLDGRVQAAVGAIRPAAGGLDMAALYSANLISGMVCE
ncbi:biotin-dependent carboxyltransferase family protein [Magnetospirillum sp. SS-4]|uniref:5-oxoprolinase subunit C family protein n=1 Tax=Magnetospirillum sp. SS-4 TaxID=2681465 RepID=UPI00137C7AC3|nr:biotin-dependent carboxyltransferase family protein [Magnetospirillum sp. SS-4]CAA7625151.1 putative Allophanate hydrolase, subunit 2 [Magnetospirillum sp. SS-4]